VISGIVIGGEAAVARFDAFPNRLRDELKVGIGRAALLVQGNSKEKLSDDVLHVKTGRLRRSINVKDQSTGDTVQASVGTNVVYAHAHEYGFQGTVSVREHLSTSVKGKKFTVRSHDMKMNMPERSFLRSALAAMAEPIRAEFEAALQRSIA
jgi:phage gpG-like protein